MKIALAVAVLAAFAPPLMAQHHGAMPHPSPADTDTAYRAMQRRGAGVMGVDQYTSRHVFEPLPDGGRIELQRLVDDSAGVARIRSHMAEIAAAFARGDFSAPGLVHRQQVPGTRIMAAKRSVIAYRAAPLPRGGEVRITTRDPEAVAAIHEFLEFQTKEHRTR